MAIFSDITDSGGTGNINWGHINGNLSDQTDLKNALDGKVDLDGSNATFSNLSNTAITNLSNNFVENDGSNATFKHIIETYKSPDGLSWYRKYSDGWVEQGGMIGGSYGSNANINFLVPFINTKYIINFTNYSTDTGSITNKRNLTLNGYSTTGINFQYNANVACWEAKGYFQ
jgi:hypothetical protein